MMTEANVAWENFMNQLLTNNPNAAPPGPGSHGQRFEFGMGKPFAQAPVSGVQFGGFANYDATQGKWVLNTIFIEETWI
jgi:hypothetical protein